MNLLNDQAIDSMVHSLLIPAPAESIQLPESRRKKESLLAAAANANPPPDPAPGLPPTPLRLEAWKARLEEIKYPLTNEILDFLTRGADVGLRSADFTRVRRCANLPSATGEANEKKILDELIKETSLGRLAGPFLSVPIPNLQISPIGAVPKKNSEKLRMIHHLSYPRDKSGTSINAQIADFDCQYLAFDSAVDRIRRIGKSCLLSKFDVNEAYRYLRIRPDQQIAFGICFRGLYYFERCLPFGLKSAPAIFEKFATAINAFMAFKNLQVVHFMDDFLCISSSDIQSAVSDFIGVLTIFKELGVSISARKLVKPATELEFLGWWINSTDQTISLPTDKLERYRKEIASYKETDNRYLTMQQLDSLIGKLVHSAYAIPHGRTFYQRLLQLKRKHHGSKKRIYLHDAALADLDWWHHFLQAWNGKAKFPPAPSTADYGSSAEFTIFTDACEGGMGAWFPKLGLYCAHQWTEEETARAKRGDSRSMPYLEFRAIVLSVSTWKDELQGKVVLIRTDCSAAQENLLSGRSKDPQTMELIRSLVFLCCQFNIFLACSHIAGTDNVHADALSRFDFSRFFQILNEPNSATGNEAGTQSRSSCSGRRSRGQNQSATRSLLKPMVRESWFRSSASSSRGTQSLIPPSGRI